MLFIYILVKLYRIECETYFMCMVYIFGGRLNVEAMTMTPPH